MNKRQAKKRIRVMGFVNYIIVKPVPHGYWKRQKENDKRFGFYSSPFPRWKTRLRWLIKQDMAEVKSCFCEVTKND